MELMNDETVIWEGHPTWRAMLAFHIKGFAIAIAAALLLVAIRWIGADISTFMIVLLVLIIVGVTILSGWIMRFFTEYAITTKRLHIRRGILSKTESSTNVDRIQNITTFQSPVERILRCGTIDFDTAGDSDTDQFSFIGVNNPQDLRERIMQARDAEKTAGHDPQGGLA
ncbi:MAG: PH domain-containing protein [Solirubrobacterales bacterium]